MTMQSSIAAALHDLYLLFSDPGVISTDANDLLRYAQSTYVQFPGSPHNVVIHARSTDDVVRAVGVARKHLMPVVPYSGGTSLEGNLSALQHHAGSICIDTSRMSRIIQINGGSLSLPSQFYSGRVEADADVTCEAGVTWNVLNDTLKEKGIPLFFPLDPAAGATIGGMISQGCSGTNAVRYGTARGEYILNVTVVLPSGEVIKTRQRARKSSAGFDVTKLFIGAEGTLGIITEATLRLVPLLPSSVAVVSFPDVRSATQAVCDVLNHGATIQCAELMDALAIRAMNTCGKSKQKWAETDTIFFKYQGSDVVMEDTSRLVQATVKKYGGSGYYHVGGAVADQLWTDRKNALFAVLQMHPGSRGYITDVCVPVSRLPDMVHATKIDCASRGLIAPIGGHVGDGNFHAVVLYHNDAELKLVREVVDRMVHNAQELDGTCTGEHGVGLGKKQYLVAELGEGTVALMQSIKNTLDPLNLFSPGKLYPDTPIAKL